MQRRASDERTREREHEACEGEKRHPRFGEWYGQQESEDRRGHLVREWSGTLREMECDNQKLWREIMAIGIGTVVLVIAALAFSFKQHVRTQPGSRGHRSEEEIEESERVSPDGYIDSFAGLIEEAGGSLPPAGG